MKFTKNFLLLLVLAFVFALAACSGGGDNATDKPADSKDSTDAPAASEGGGELVYVSGSDAPTLDPHGSNDTSTTTATSQIFETLTTYAADGSVVPLLATEFSSVDETTWEFKLREGVKFHDGTDFNADAVKLSIERIIDPEFASPRAVVLNMITEVVVVDPLTVHVKTAFPFAPLPAHLAHNAGSIVAPSAIEEERSGGKKVDENPIGSGPFKFESWNRGAEIVFVKNENYWGELAKVDRVVMKNVPEQATRVAMLETGEAHVMLVGASDVERVSAMPGIEIDNVRGTRMDYLGFNMNVAPFDNIKVRQAIAMAINKDDIVNGVLDGQGVEAVGPLAPTVVGNYQGLTPLPYDVEGAKALLAEAGFADGFKTKLMVNEGNKERADIAELIQAQLMPLGIEVEIDIIEWGTFLEKTAAGEHELFILGWTTVTGDADYGLYALFHSKNFGSPGNRSFYKNERVDELLDLARQNPDQDARNEAYKEISEILVEEVPMAYLQHPDFNHGMNGIEGLFVNFSGTPFFKGVSLK
ncbi:glutathione ABC transporter substrate-binding protein [Bacillus luteolus]|uniref:Glutathione ABC transporter substrate-binding protein n=1 Tax=Litchfieldia luteola TaxID=682179 RepID=A0ABR9QQK2_9BACI|nr:glutathione ABC transporter substrate-binding protein [Cytobacillus luteolus]MBE4910484.1 glutathione ABC transporter substrate-binding protein [Cytobacillus luteolus]MBP1943659.1 peptide/nickel transport system substrate-binding protein [Cytobacillus luteolus]